MSSPFSRFPTAGVLRRLGISDPEHYAISGGPMVPTVQLLDLSRSLATEPIEARGYKWIELFGQVGYAVLRLNARGGAALVVERLFVEDPAGENACSFAVEPIVGFVEAAQQTPTNIGGVAITATLESAASLVDRPTPPNWEAVNRSVLLEPRIFVPSGFRLSVQNHTINARLALAVLWRELQP